MSYKLKSYVDVDTNISQKKKQYDKVTQNRRIALFSLWSLNQKEARRRTLNFPMKKKKRKRKRKTRRIFRNFKV